MSLGPRLDLRQQQMLVMTPQLQQAIKLLALTNLEVEAFLDAEIERNPLLDTAASETEADGDADRAAEPDVTPDQAGEGDASEPVSAVDLLERGENSAEPTLDVEPVAEGSASDAAFDAPAGNGAGDASSEGNLDLFANPPEALRDVLAAQAGRVLGGTNLAVALFLIDLIDEAGYFTGNLAECAAALGIDEAETERVLLVIQSFEPTGVGARTLGECLALQAREADRLDPAMACMLKHLDLVARGDLAALRRVCGVDAADVADMVRELRAYNPKPGLLYGGERLAPVVPDVFVRRAREGWTVELNSQTLPRLIVDRAYHAKLSARAVNGEKAFLSECLSSANWLVRALDQRANTIVKVTTEIVRRQEAFFESGVAALRPLTLRAIADEIGMHESTVSRVTSNKYLACERGTFELKWFFRNAIHTADGEDASAEAVRARLRALIAAEPPHAPLSDDKLLEKLSAEGFDIARRTVAKYREAMGLGSSVQRRRQRLIEAA